MRYAFLAATLLACTRPPPAPHEAADPGGPSTIHFLGDLHFGESYARDVPDRYEAPVEPLRGFLATGRAVANLEGTFASAHAEPLGPDREFLHWSDGVATAGAARRLHVAATSLANNHAMDFGLDALLETRRELGRSRIASFGAGANRSAAARPLELPGVAVIAAYWARPSYRRLGFYASRDHGGVRELDASVVEQVRELKAADADRRVVVYPHWGRNYRWRNADQRKWARRLIDAGADLVVGHGAHRYQEVERYGGRWILYGLGNAVFLTPGRYAEHAAPPYSLVATLAADGGSLILRVVASDNTATGYRPHLLRETAFHEALRPLRSRSCRRDPSFCALGQIVHDRFGGAVRLPLEP